MQEITQNLIEYPGSFIFIASQVDIQRNFRKRFGQITARSGTKAEKLIETNNNHA